MRFFAALIRFGMRMIREKWHEEQRRGAGVKGAGESLPSFSFVFFYHRPTKWHRDASAPHFRRNAKQKSKPWHRNAKSDAPKKKRNGENRNAHKHRGPNSKKEKEKNDEKQRKGFGGWGRAVELLWCDQKLGRKTQSSVKIRVRKPHNAPSAVKSAHLRSVFPFSIFFFRLLFFFFFFFFFFQFFLLSFCSGSFSAGRDPRRCVRGSRGGRLEKGNDRGNVR